MADETELQPLREWIHKLNNHVGVILATSELLQMEQLSPKGADRTRTIENKALEMRELLRTVADHYFT